MSDAALALCRRYAPYLDRPPEAVAADLESFADLVWKWNRTRNLVSRETAATLWPRHIADSLQLAKFIGSGDRMLLDLGSGGGFPAVPLALARRDLDVRLVEANAGKAAFLKAVSRELGLGLTVDNRRIEAVAADWHETADLVTARALAPLPRLLGLVAPFAAPRTRLLLPKGREHVEELAKAAALWHYGVLVHASDSSVDGVILELSGLAVR